MATTEAKFKPATVGRSRLPLVVTVAAIVLLAVFAAFVSRTSATETSKALAWAVAAVALVIVGLRAYARRR
jgi:hypothetical protein